MAAQQTGDGDRVDALPEITNWDPISLEDVKSLFKDYPGTWCIAGGWAIDLFAGEQSRPHADIDLVVDRADLAILHQALPGWLLYAAGDGKLTSWQAGTPLRHGVHDIWCRRPGNPWEFQLMVSELTDREWVFRRDARIREPRDTMILSIDGLPVLAPEIQLLYKSRIPNRPRDERDFEHTLPHLSPVQRQWLSANLALLYGDHPWIAVLDGGA